MDEHLERTELLKNERLNNIYLVLRHILNESLDTVDMLDTSPEGWRQLYGIHVDGNNLINLQSWRTQLDWDYPRIMAGFLPTFVVTRGDKPGLLTDHLNQVDVDTLKLFFETNSIPNENQFRWWLYLDRGYCRQVEPLQKFLCQSNAKGPLLLSQASLHLGKSRGIDM